MHALDEKFTGYKRDRTCFRALQRESHGWGTELISTTEELLRSTEINFRHNSVAWDLFDEEYTVNKSGEGEIRYADGQ